MKRSYLIESLNTETIAVKVSNDGKVSGIYKLKQ